MSKIWSQMAKNNLHYIIFDLHQAQSVPKCVSAVRTLATVGTIRAADRDRCHLTGSMRDWSFRRDLRSWDRIGLVSAGSGHCPRSAYTGGTDAKRKRTIEIVVWVTNQIDLCIQSMLNTGAGRCALNSPKDWVVILCLNAALRAYLISSVLIVYTHLMFFWYSTEIST